jgi:hypothetical protein
LNRFDCLRDFFVVEDRGLYCSYFFTRETVIIIICQEFRKTKKGVQKSRLKNQFFNFIKKQIASNLKFQLWPPKIQCQNLATRKKRELKRRNFHTNLSNTNNFNFNEFAKKKKSLKNFIKSYFIKFIILIISSNKNFWYFKSGSAKHLFKNSTFDFFENSHKIFLLLEILE